MKAKVSAGMTVVSVLLLAAAWIYPVYVLSSDWSTYNRHSLSVLAIVLVAFALLLARMLELVSHRDALLLIPALAVNSLLATLVSVFHLPLYLDTVGTILIAVLLGPHAGATAGVATALISAIVSPAGLAFVAIHAFVGMSAGVLSEMGAFRSPFWAVVGGLFVGVPAGILASPMNALVYGDVVHGTQLAIISDRLDGQSLVTSILSESMIFEPLDKIFAFLLAWALLSTIIKPDRTSDGEVATLQLADDQQLLAG